MNLTSLCPDCLNAISRAVNAEVDAAPAPVCPARPCDCGTRAEYLADLEPFHGEAMTFARCGTCRKIVTAEEMGGDGCPHCRAHQERMKAANDSRADQNNVKILDLTKRF